MEYIVKIEKLSMKYQSRNGEICALADINLDVATGEYVSIVGPSGCGKSTLLSMIAGLIPITCGNIYIMGEPIKGTSPLIGYMLQKDHLFGWRTIWQNVCLGLEVRHIKTDENLAYVENLLKTYGLSEFKDKYPSQLSGGMRQRCALIRTLATRPELLLLDEAFSALDYQTRLAVSDDIYNIIKSEKKTAIMVTHDIAESICMSDRVIVLERRPAEVRSIHEIDFPLPRSPIACRESERFSGYFNAIWKELDIHV